MTTITDELKFIQKQHGGMINPTDVVNFARNPKTFLHDKFEWDDAKAGYEYRLHQARNIIRLELVVFKTDPSGNVSCSPEVQEGGKGKIVRAFVSLSDDRGQGGYRSIFDVLNDPNLKEKMLEEAKKEMLIFRRKYGVLEALAEVFEAMDRV